MGPATNKGTKHTFGVVGMIAASQVLGDIIFSGWRRWASHLPYFRRRQHQWRRAHDKDLRPIEKGECGERGGGGREFDSSRWIALSLSLRFRCLLRFFSGLIAWAGRKRGGIPEGRHRGVGGGIGGFFRRTLIWRRVGIRLEIFIRCLMAEGSSFDHWQKDVFFSAAEEVQESADALESLYRIWMRYLKDGFPSGADDELHRELHIALGTAKWQLEEFEKAVRLSHEKYPSEANTITRHEHFMEAIGNQISHIEKALRDEGKQPLRWIQLNAEEQDDFALFLSEVPLNLQVSSQGNSWSECAKGSKDTVVASNGTRHAMEVATREPHKSVEQLSGLRRTSSSVDESSWKIEVSDDIEADSRQSVEPIPEMRINSSILSRLWKSVESSRLRLFRNSSKKLKSEEQLQFRHGFLNYMDMKRIACLAQRISRLTERSRGCIKATSSQQLATRIEVVQRQIPGSQYQMQFGPSLRLAFLLLLSIILIVPFVLYST